MTVKIDENGRVASISSHDCPTCGAKVDYDLRTGYPRHIEKGTTDRICEEHGPDQHRVPVYLSVFGDDPSIALDIVYNLELLLRINNIMPHQHRDEFGRPIREAGQAVLWLRDNLRHPDRDMVAREASSMLSEVIMHMLVLAFETRIEFRNPDWDGES